MVKSTKRGLTQPTKKRQIVSDHLFNVVMFTGKLFAGFLFGFFTVVEFNS
jgi:hypothetical protein